MESVTCPWFVSGTALLETIAPISSLTALDLQYISAHHPVSRALDLSSLYNAAHGPRLPALRHVQFHDGFDARWLPWAAPRALHPVADFLTVYGAQLHTVELHVFEAPAVQTVLQAALACRGLRELSLTFAKGGAGYVDDSVDAAAPSAAGEGAEQNAAQGSGAAASGAGCAVWRKSQAFVSMSGFQPPPGQPLLHTLELCNVQLSERSLRELWHASPALQRCIVISEPPTILSAGMLQFAVARGISVVLNERREKIERREKRRRVMTHPSTFQG